MTLSLHQPMPQLSDPSVLRRVLWVEANQAEEPKASNGLLSASIETVRSESIESAISKLEAEGLGVCDSRFDLVVLNSPRPLADTEMAGALAQRASSSLRVQRLGVWCEGEERTGRIAPGWRRVFWHAWPIWFTRWLHGQAGENAASLEGVVVSVQSSDSEDAKAVRAALTPMGARVVWGRHSAVISVGEQPAVGLWVGKQLSGSEADSLNQYCQRMSRSGGRVIALLDFPRPETVAAAEAIGADFVIGKPYRYEDIVSAVSQLATQNVSRRSAIRPPLTAAMPVAPEQLQPGLHRAA